MERITKVIAMTMILIVAMGWLAAELMAESRTLTTHIVVTVRPSDPQLTKAPEGVKEMYQECFPATYHDRYVRLEDPYEAGLEIPRYTIAEKL